MSFVPSYANDPQLLPLICAAQAAVQAEREGRAVRVDLIAVALEQIGLHPDQPAAQPWPGRAQ